MVANRQAEDAAAENAIAALQDGDPNYPVALVAKKCSEEIPIPRRSKGEPSSRSECRWKPFSGETASRAERRRPSATAGRRTKESPNCRCPMARSPIDDFRVEERNGRRESSFCPRWTSRSWRLRSAASIGIADAQVRAGTRGPLREWRER